MGAPTFSKRVSNSPSLWLAFIYNTLTDALGYHLHTAVIDAQSVVPQHRERILLVGFKERRRFEFPQFPAEGPKLNSILENDVPEKYTFTDHLWD